MTTSANAQQLLALLARLSFRLGQFTLASGATSDYYIDCRTTTLHAEGGRLTGHAILELLEAHNIQAEAVGGLTMGADPIVSNVATASAQRAIDGGALDRPAHSNPAAPLIHGFLVRKAEKTHGTGRRIEGFCQPGARVIIVDDVCTTGGSAITAIEAAREAGMVIAAVVCIVEREEANGRPAVESAADGAPFLALFTATKSESRKSSSLGPRSSHYSIFDPGVYRNRTAKWHFLQENATLDELEMPACGSKMLYPIRYCEIGVMIFADRA